MRIPYGFTLTCDGTLEVNKGEANIVCMIFDFYMAGASLGKVVDILHAKQIPSPTGKVKWTRAAVDHHLSNGKYIAIIGLDKFMDVQFEKSARCNVDYDKEGAPRKDTRYVSHVMIQIRFFFHISTSYATIASRGETCDKENQHDRFSWHWKFVGIPCGSG